MKRIDLRDNGGIGENGACSMLIACFGKVDLTFDAEFKETQKLAAGLKDVLESDANFDSKSAGGKVSALSRAFSESDVVRSILCTSYIDANTMQTLFESIPEMLSLDLSNCNVDDYGIEQLVLRFGYLPLLKELDLSDNAFGVSGCETLGKCLRNVPSLQKLHLGGVR